MTFVTATHMCRCCNKKTTHTLVVITIDNQESQALRCVVCGNLVPISMD